MTYYVISAAKYLQSPVEGFLIARKDADGDFTVPEWGPTFPQLDGYFETRESATAVLQALPFGQFQIEHV